MRIYGYICLLFAIVLAINANHQQQFIPLMQNTFSNGFNPEFQSPAVFRIPFPQCLSTERAADLLNANTIAGLFQVKLHDEELKLKQERIRNDNLNNSMFIRLK